MLRVGLRSPKTLNLPTCHARGASWTEALPHAEPCTWTEKIWTEQIWTEKISTGTFGPGTKTAGIRIEKAASQGGLFVLGNEIGFAWSLPSVDLRD